MYEDGGESIGLYLGNKSPARLPPAHIKRGRVGWDQDSHKEYFDTPFVEPPGYTTKVARSMCSNNCKWVSRFAGEQRDI